MKTTTPIAALLPLLLATTPLAFADAGADGVQITVDPYSLRTINGIGDLDRQTVFNLCDPGKGFDQRIDSEGRMVELLDKLNISFGRSLGPVNAVVKWGGGVKEDPARPGFADIKELKNRLSPQKPGSTFRRLAEGRLDVAAHGSHNAYPEFMGQVSTEHSTEGHKPQYLPENIEAAAELAATVMAENYSGFDRPRYYEPVNEPHWSFTGGEHLAKWHLATKYAVQEQSPEVKVGGPCLPVAYFYKRNFGAFNGLKDFMAKTDGQMDFYSFHVYDYLSWQDGKVEGRVTTGLPIEGALDVVQAHAFHTYGREYDIVVSEHGGYFSDDSVQKMAQEFLPEGEGFEHEMQVRSIANHALVSAAIANTLTFLDHPHVVRKAVPFILLESMNWDPKYYSTAFVAYDFKDKKRWVESSNLDFYKFFRDLSGQRVIVDGGDPDLQTRAFMDGKDVRIVINNLSREAESVSIKLPEPGRIAIRRYARNDNYTPALTEAKLKSLEDIEIGGREAIMVTARYRQPIKPTRTINEVPYYADTVAVQPQDGKPARFRVEIPETDGAVKATLRIGIVRPPNSSPDVQVMLNGKRLKVPLEDSVDRLTNKDEYASTKLIAIDPGLLKKTNTVLVAFPDDLGGAVGTAVIRVGYEHPAGALPSGEKTGEPE